MLETAETIFLVLVCGVQVLLSGFALRLLYRRTVVLVSFMRNPDLIDTRDYFEDF